MCLRRFATWNMWDFYRSETTEERKRQQSVYQAVADVVRPDILAVQEIIAPAEGGGKAVTRLADATGLVAGPVSRGHQISPYDLYYWVALLWSPDIVAVADTIRDYSAEMWHSLVTCTVTVDGVRIKIGSHHARPFGRHARVDEAERVVSAYRRPRPALPGLLGSDSNGVSGDRIADESGRWVLHDPSQPYNDTPSFSGDFVHQTHWSYTDSGQRVWTEDRDDGDVLWSGGLSSVRSVLGAPPVATAGHVETGDFGSREIDHVRANEAMCAAVVDVDTPTTLDSWSDHRPVIATFDTARLQ